MHDGHFPTVPPWVFDEDAAVSWKTYRMGLRSCPPVPFVSLHNQIGKEKYMNWSAWIAIAIAVLEVIREESD